MPLSTKAAVRLAVAAANGPLGNEVITAINTGTALAGQSGVSIPAAIVATSTSSTTDFAALKVGDKVIHVPAVASTDANFVTVATAGTLPVAAVIGDLYLVLRTFTAPAITNVGASNQ